MVIYAAECVLLLMLYHPRILVVRKGRLKNGDVIAMQDLDRLPSDRVVMDFTVTCQCVISIS